MRLKTFLLACLCSILMLSTMTEQRASAQTMSRNAAGDADPTAFMGQDIRVTTVTGAVWQAA